MKWFAHHSNASEDPVIFEATERFGALAYWVYFGILELMASNFNPKMPGNFSGSWKQIRNKFKCYSSSLEPILNYYQSKSKFRYIREGDSITINCPKFKEFIDDYTKRKIRDMSGHDKPKCTDKKTKVSGYNTVQYKRDNIVSSTKEHEGSSGKNRKRRFFQNPFSRKPDSMLDSIIDDVQVSLQIDDSEIPALKRLVAKCPDQKRWNELIAACKDFRPNNVMAYLTKCIGG